MIVSREVAGQSSGLVDVREVARLASCSPRHVFRLVKRGMIPPPVKVGRLTRFQRELIETWISEGCPPVQNGGRR
jgi:excisionase family DNA binding protein